MSSSLHRHPAARLALAFALALSACGGQDPVLPAPSVSAVKPACGDAAATTAVSIQGTMPASPEISFSDPGSSRLDTTYRAWIALPGGNQVELTGLSWKSATELSAVVPLGLAAGSYTVTLQGPTGAQGSMPGAFRVQQGPCPVETAALVVTGKAEPATVTVGHDVTVVATVQNVGQAGALGVAASVVPPSATFTVQTSPAGPQDVPAGQARTFTWTYRATAPGAGVFLVGAGGTAADTGQIVAAQPVNTNEVLATTGSFLTANTVASSSKVTVGQFLTVILTVTNPTTAAVVATPAMAVTGPVTANGAPPVPVSIPAGDTRAFVWGYTANAAGTATFTAGVSGTNPSTGLVVSVPTAPVSVLVQPPPALSASLSIPTAVEVGADFTATMVVSNSGPAGAADVAQMTPDQPTVRTGSTATAAFKSGPLDAAGKPFTPATVAVGHPVTVTWLFTATAPGTVSIGSIARGQDANTLAAVASAEAISNVAQLGRHTLGGTVSGLTGTGLVLHNGAESLTIPAGATTFTFATPVFTGATFAVTATGQPSAPTQVCAVANGSGTVGAANVTTVAVTCTTSSFTVGGTISGLTGTGLVLSNGAENLTVPANATSFTFATPVASGAAYAVTPTGEPTGPTQTCTVTNGTGTVGAANVTTVTVTCSRRAFTIGGIVTGLAGTGLVLSDGSESLPITANGPFTFPTAVASGTPYAVTVTTPPATPTQLCTVTNGTGIVGGVNVLTVAVSCSTSSFTVGGTVSGLAAGNSVTLRNGTESLVVSSNAAYAFVNPVASGATYAVTVTVQPSTPTQVCTVTNGSGTVGAASVTNVAVACVTSAFTVGGTISGLAGTGLVLHNGTESLTIPAGATSFTLATPVASGAAYAVTVTVQPTTPAQVCTVTNGAGTVVAANVTNVAVACTTSSFTVGGTVSGLAAGNSVTLRNGTESLVVSSNAAYAFVNPVASGATYAVTVTVQPSTPTQVCTVTNGSGTVGAASVTNVAVACVTSAFTVGGTISGLAGTGLVLHNGTESLTIPAGATSFTLATPVASGAAYAVTVTVQPTTPAQVCTVTNGAGTVVAANVTNVAVACTTSSFTVGGTVSGLAAGNSVTLHNGTESLVVSSNAAYAFVNPVASGATYAVTVTVQPSTPTQVCTVTNGSGTVGAANVTNAAVACATSAFTVGGTVSGLAAGNSVTLRNGTESLVVSANAAYAFVNLVASGATYAVTVTVQPTTPTQVCTVTSGTGTVGAANVTTVAVSCVTSSFTVGGTISGLAGTGLVLHNGTESLTIPAGATSFTLATPVASGAAYAVTVTVQPSTPTQVCTVTNGTGTVVAANVTNVAVACVTSAFTVGGTLTGLATGGFLVLANNATDTLMLSANGPFTFATSLPSGSTYAVTVVIAPGLQLCVVAGGDNAFGGGTVLAADVTSVQVFCI